MSDETNAPGPEDTEGSLHVRGITDDEQDDVQGHARRFITDGAPDEDVEGHKRKQMRATVDEDDVEGHHLRKFPRAVDEDDVEGHSTLRRRPRAVDDGEDVEGHTSRIDSSDDPFGPLKR